MAKKKDDPLAGWEEREAAKPPHVPVILNEYDNNGEPDYKTMELVLDKRLIDALREALKMEPPPRKKLDYQSMRLEVAEELISRAASFPDAEITLNWDPKYKKRSIKLKEAHVLHPDDITRYQERMKAIGELEEEDK